MVETIAVTPKPRESTVKSIRSRIDLLFHPASSVALNQLQSIIGSLPDQTSAVLKEKLKEQAGNLRFDLSKKDRSLVTNSLIESAFYPTVGTLIGSIVGSVVTLGNPYGGFAGAGTGILLAFQKPSVAEKHGMKIKKAVAIERGRLKESLNNKKPENTEEQVSRIMLAITNPDAVLTKTDSQKISAA